MTPGLDMGAACSTARRPMRWRKPDSLTSLLTCETCGPLSDMPAGSGIAVTGYTARSLMGAALANIGTSGSSRCMLGGSGRLGLLVLFGRDGVLSVLVAGVAVIVLLTAV